MTIPLQFASLYDGQVVFAWSDCLLHLGMAWASLLVTWWGQLWTTLSERTCTVGTVYQKGKLTRWGQLAVDHFVKKGNSHSGNSYLWTVYQKGEHTQWGQSIRKGNSQWVRLVVDHCKKGNSHSGDSSICLRVLPPALVPGRPSGRHEDTCRRG